MTPEQRVNYDFNGALEQDAFRMMYENAGSAAALLDSLAYSLYGHDMRKGRPKMESLRNNFVRGFEALTHDADVLLEQIGRKEKIARYTYTDRMRLMSLLKGVKTGLDGLLKNTNSNNASELMGRVPTETSLLARAMLYGAYFTEKCDITDKIRASKKAKEERQKTDSNPPSESNA